MPATYYIDILNGLYLRDLAFAQLWPSFLDAGRDGGAARRPSTSGR
ncbi:MAG: hypothetical protein MZW92_21765 [Comamonadaceae bacterium]|nr:hypothetical protein [Comamonadaceae bacterium]